MDAFTINIITDCSNPVSLTASAPVNQEYTITDTAKTYQIPAFVWEPPFCPITYTYSVAAIMGETVVSFDSAESVHTFTFHKDNDLSISGPVSTTYTITVTGTIGDGATMSEQASFDLLVKNPCIDKSFVDIQTAPLPTGMTYTLHSFSTASKYSFTHDPFVITTSPIVHTLCGDLVYDVTFAGISIDDASDPMSYTQATNAFAIYSEDDLLIGP